jgi:hypothetical protein
MHQRVLDRLIEQRKIDTYGGIGWMAPLEEFRTVVTVEAFYQPLLQRCMVEDCQSAMNHPSGKFFVRITDLGVKCDALGMMMKQPLPASSYDLVVMQRELPEPK